jgi:hypothetical protein
MLHGKTREQAEALYEARKAFYAKADFAVDTTTLNPDQVSAEVQKALRARPPHLWSPHPTLSPTGGEGSGFFPLPPHEW